MVLMSIKRKIGAVVAGWMMTLVVAIVRSIVKRALAKTAQRQQAYAPQRPPQPQAPRARSTVSKPQPFKAWAVTDTIYQGMNQSELIAAYGEPSRKFASTTTREVWTYAPRVTANDNGQPGMTVIIDRGIVTDWTEDAA